VVSSSRRLAISWSPHLVASQHPALRRFGPPGGLAHPLAPKGPKLFYLRTPEGQKLYEELLQIKDDKQKLREIYYGKPRKERKLKQLTPEEIERIIKEYEGLEVEEPMLAKK
jgi:hypothetical protein